MEGRGCHSDHVPDGDDHVRPAEGAVESHVVRAVCKAPRTVRADLLTQAGLALDGDLEEEGRKGLRGRHRGPRLLSRGGT